MSERQVRRRIREGFLTLLGIVSATIGLKGFLLPAHFVDGGVTGISMLVAHATGWPLGLLIFVLNFPFVVLGFWQVSRSFSIKTFIATTVLSVALLLVPEFAVTEDKLLVAVFGGFFLGGGIGFAVRGGSVIDGTEVLAVYLSRRLAATIGDIILAINLLIFVTAAGILDLEKVLYSIITYLAASKTIDFIITGVEEYTGVTIISQNSEAIRKSLVSQLRRGVTVYYGRGGYSPKSQAKDMEVLYTVITRLEISTMQRIVLQEDPRAFVITHSINDAKGGMIKKRPLH